jgi:two-component system sensor histidine kinase PilS (NtrC family)
MGVIKETSISQDLLSRPRLVAEAGYPDSFWRSLFYFNVYRTFVAALLLIAAQLFEDSVFGSRSSGLFLYASLTYIAFAGLAFLPISSHRPDFSLQLGVGVVADILFVTLLVYASSGVTSGLGLLLLASLAAAGIISRGRMTLFFAALASVAVLLEQTYEVISHTETSTHYIQAGLLSIGYFATAWLGHTLARYTQASEQLAAQREVDLANMAQVNQLVIQDMKDGVLVVDERGSIRQINRRAVEILGPLPKAGRELTLRDYNAQLSDRLQRWREDPDAGFDPMRTVLTHRLMGARFVPVGKSRNVGVVVFLEDLTRIQAEAQQLKLAAMGRLTANIAHEIRNPLSAINHAAELLLEEPEISETQRRLLQIVHDNTQRLDRMVQDVLKLNRRDRAHRETFQMGMFLRTFVAQFCQIEKIPEEIISLTIDTDPTVTFDRSHLNQVMWNLCRNALRYSQRKTGSISISMRAGDPSNGVELAVADDGPGVPEAIRPHLFEPFFTTAASGTGLGLYIAREICDANNASLEYVEQPSGAMFMVVFRGGRT